MNTEYNPTQEQFHSDVANGKMEVLMDNGLYRHLRFRMANGSFGWFDIVTWPGNLVITGDTETYTFNRIDDMFEFFSKDNKNIKPKYWQEKIVDGNSRARSFCWEKFREQALSNFDTQTSDETDKTLLLEARNDLEESLDNTEPDESGAIQFLRDYEFIHDGETYFSFNLTEDAPDGMEWNFHYIWCCRAILWAVEQYKKQCKKNE